MAERSYDNFSSLESDEDSAEEEREMNDIVEKVIAHITDMRNGSEEAKTVENRDPFLHMVRVKDQKISRTYTARIQDATLSHALTSNNPKLRWKEKSEGVMVDTDATKGSSKGQVQTIAYCAAVGQDAQLDASRAPRCHFGIGSAHSKVVAVINFPIGENWFF